MEGLGHDDDETAGHDIGCINGAAYTYWNHIADTIHTLKVWLSAISLLIWSMSTDDWSWAPGMLCLYAATTYDSLPILCAGKNCDGVQALNPDTLQDGYRLVPLVSLFCLGILSPIMPIVTIVKIRGENRSVAIIVNVVLLLLSVLNLFFVMTGYWRLCNIDGTKYEPVVPEEYLEQDLEFETLLQRADDAQDDDGPLARAYREQLLLSRFRTPWRQGQSVSDVDYGVGETPMENDSSHIDGYVDYITPDIMLEQIIHTRKSQDINDESSQGSLLESEYGEQTLSSHEIRLAIDNDLDFSQCSVSRVYPYNIQSKPWAQVRIFTNTIWILSVFLLVVLVYIFRPPTLGPKENFGLPHWVAYMPVIYGSISVFRLILFYLFVYLRIPVDEPIRLLCWELFPIPILKGLLDGILFVTGILAVPGTGFFGNDLSQTEPGEPSGFGWSFAEIFMFISLLVLFGHNIWVTLGVQVTYKECRLHRVLNSSLQVSESD